MSDSSKKLSRRELFGTLFSPLKRAGDAVRTAAPSSETSAPSLAPSMPVPRKVAVIAGRQCLAYQDIPCTVCHERCPVEGALPIEAGLPRVNWDLCTGCAVCREVCPAPENAVLLVPAPTTGSPNAGPPDL